MTQKDIAHLRLFNQQIARAACKTSEEVVSKLGAMQAQDYAGALWAIGLRLPNASETDIEEAIARRAIVRTWPMRGTLHFIAATDVHWMLKLLAPRIITTAARRHQQLELDEKTFVQCEKILVRALQGGVQLTREETLTLLQREKIAVDNQRGYHILWRLAQERVLCFGTRQGKQQTFTLLHEWIPVMSNLDHDAALEELSWRYFSGHGPATLQDFIWWYGLKVSEARAGLEAASPKLIKETIEGKVYWMSTDIPSLDQASSGIFLLPGFDEYMLGYQDRSASLDPQYARRIVPGGNGMFLSTIISDGQVVGTWKRLLKKKSVSITANPFTSLGKRECYAFEEACQNYAYFLSLSVRRDINSQPTSPSDRKG